MRPETSAWLEPMLSEAERRHDIDIKELMRQATMPAAEMDTPFGDWLERTYGDMPGVRTGGIDWIRFGALLRDALGWRDYPDQPPGLSRDDLN